MILLLAASRNQHTLSHSYTNLLHPWSGWSVVSALFDSVMCYICVFPCKMPDQAMQRNIYFNIIICGIMSAEKINPFDLNRTEYAELLGISPEAVRMRLRRGKLEGEYKFENGKYFFRAPLKARDYQVKTTGQMSTLKKKINRGAHETSKNPRYYPQLKARNEAVKLAALKYKISDEIQDRLPRAIEIAQREYLDDRKKLEESNNSRSKLHQYTTGIFNESNKGYDDLRYHNGRAHESQPNKFTATNRGRYKTPKEYY